MMRHKNIKSSQQGAALIEFALVLPILLALLTGVIYYGYVFMLDAAVTHAAKQGAQIAASIDPVAFTQASDYRMAVTTQVTDSVSSSLAWLSETVPNEASTVCFPGEDCGVPACMETTVVCISVELEVAPATGSPLLPQITLPGIGAVPPLPPALNGVAQVVL